MAWPDSYDGVITGQPYTNNTEYIDASFATAWATIIQNIEAGIGYGSGSVDAKPRYSDALSAGLHHGYSTHLLHRAETGTSKRHFRGLSIQRQATSSQSVLQQALGTAGS